MTQVRPSSDFPYHDVLYIMSTLVLDLFDLTLQSGLVTFNMQTVIVLVLITLSVAYAQIPTPCYAPFEMEARIIEVDPSKEFELRGKLSYDVFNKRMRVVEEVNLHDRRDFYDTLYLHNEGIEYALNLRTKRCERRRLTRPFRPFEIPRNATFYGELYLGDMLLLQSWAGQSKTGRYHLLWTVHECLPVVETYYSSPTGFVETTFFDVTRGISDPNVFIPPKECR